MVGGVCINTGTIPSKTLREAVLYLTGMNMRDLYGQNYRVKDDITVQDLLARTTHVIGRETEVIRSQLFRNRVELLHGTGRFVDDHTLAVRSHETDADTPRLRRTRSSSRSAPARPARRASTSTRSGSSTPTASCTWTRCRAPWSSSAPA